MRPTPCARRPTKRPLPTPHPPLHLPSMPLSPEERLDALERAVAELTHEVRALGARLDAAPAPAARPRRGAAWAGTHRLALLTPAEVAGSISRYGLALLASLVFLSG